MVIFRDALKATDHTRGAGAIRGFVPCKLDRVVVEKVHEPMINWSVVMIRLLMSAPNWGATTKINEDVKGPFRGDESNHLRRALLVHPWVLCETGLGTTVRTVHMPWTLYRPGGESFQFRAPLCGGKSCQIS